MEPLTPETSAETTSYELVQCPFERAIVPLVVEPLTPETRSETTSYELVPRPFERAVVPLVGGTIDTINQR